MSIPVRCPNCGVAYDLADDQRNKWVRCRDCQQTFQVAGPPGPAPEEVLDVLPAGEAPAANPAAGAKDATEGLQAQPGTVRRAGRAESARRRRTGRSARAAAAPWHGNRVALVVTGAVVAACLLLAAGGTALWVLFSPRQPPAKSVVVVPPRVALKEAPRPEPPAELPPEPPRPVPPPFNPPPFNPPPFNPPDPLAEARGRDAPNKAHPGNTVTVRDQDKVVVALPAAAGDVAVGGGGRFLILHLPSLRKLAVFDVAQAKVIRYLPLADDHVKFAAGLDQLIVVLTGLNLVERWDLTTLEREGTAPLPVKGVVKTVALGSASAGPLLVHWAVGSGALDAASFSFLDPRTLRVLPTRWARGQPTFCTCFRDYVHVRASGDGRVFGLWCTSHTPSGLQTFVLMGDDVQAYYEHNTVGHVIPGPDGQVIYTGAGLYTNELKPVGLNPGGGRGCVPGPQGDLYLACRPNDRALTLALCRPGDYRPLANLANIDWAPTNEEWVNHPFTDDKRIHLVPEAGCVVTIPAAKDRLVVHRFDLDEALKKSGTDFLVITSLPPRPVKPGDTLTYQVAARSSKAGLNYRLDFRPEGMTISDAGQVRWVVPAQPARAETDVVVRVSDAGGQEAFHAFKVRVRPDTRPADDKGQDPPDDKDVPAAAAAPARRTAGIKAPAFDGDRLVKPLPGPAADVAVGGGGRYLILHLPAQRKLVVFDVNEAKVVHEIPADQDNVKFAAGMDKLIVMLNSGTVQRWDLTTFKKELEAPLLLNGVVKTLSMGSGSDGPLLIHWATGTRDLDQASFSFIDTQTMKFLRLERTQVTGHYFSYRDAVHVRASADGRVFGMWCTSHTPSGLQTMVFAGTEARAYYDHDSVGHVVPGPDGQVVHTALGLHTERGTLLGGDRREARPSFPAHHGPYYLGPAPADRKKGLSLYVVGDGRPLAAVPALDVPAEEEQWVRHDFTRDKRIHFLPDARLIVTIPASNDRLVLQRFDVDEALRKSELDYLFVTSRPPPSAKKGEAYVYQLEVKAKKGGVRYRLESGPGGMAMTRGGKLWWRVPADFVGAKVPVVVSIRDGDGQEVFHTFTLAVQ